MKTLALSAVLVAGALSANALGVLPQGEQTDHEHTASKLRVELKKERHAARGWRRRAAENYRRGFSKASRTILARPDAQEAVALAGIAYGQSPSQLLACAGSEGYSSAQRFVRLNTTPNKSGSGAFGAWQFMRGTFLSTPYAGLDWRSIAVQAHAAGWMWANGRRGEWAGVKC